MWTVEIQCDLIRGQWFEEYHAFLTIELYYLVARRGSRYYIHFYHFFNDYQRAQNLLDKIIATQDFSPENKPRIWIPMVDVKTFSYIQPRNWKYLLKNHSPR